MSLLQLDPKGVRAPCPGCGATNRLAYAKLAEPARCARCHERVAPPGEPIPVPSEAVFEALAGAALPVLVDFWADWCPPCRMLAPELEKAARARAGRCLVVKVDTEALPGVSQRFDVRSIPSLVMLVRGREVTRSAGAVPAATIEKLIDSAAVQ
jgi:thioredoxin 2